MSGSARAWGCDSPGLLSFRDYTKWEKRVRPFLAACNGMTKVKIVLK
jgi:hypothetical protein